MATNFPSGIDTFSTKVDRGVVYHTDINNLQDAVVALETHLRPSTAGVFNVKSAEFGATGDGVTDDSAAISAAIVAANAVTTSTTAKGATVFFPPGLYLCNSALTAPTSFVRLMGAGGIVWSNSSLSASVLKMGFTNAALIDLGSGSSNVSFINLGFVGGKTTTSGASLSHIGIKATTASSIFIHGCNFDGFGGPAIRIEGGIGKWIEYCQTTRCLMAYADLTSYAGTVHLAGTDPVNDTAGTEHNIYECNFNGPAFTAATHGAVGSGYAAAVYTNGAPNTFYKVVGAFAQTGIVIGPNVGTSPGFFTNCRAEFNQGNGWIIHGNYNTFTACSSYDNNMDSTTPTYSGFNVEQYAPRFTGNNVFVGCIVRGVTSGYAVKWGYTDNCALGATPFHAADVYVGCRAAVGVGGRMFNITGTQVPIIHPEPFTQSLTGTATKTFDGEKGNIFSFRVNGNTHSTLAASTIIPGQNYDVLIYNDSGASPTIDLATTFRTASYSSPANGKYRTARFHATGTNSLVQVGDWSADL